MSGIGTLKLLGLTLGAWLLVKITSAFWGIIRVHRVSTKLRGPPSPALLWGQGKDIMTLADPASLYSSWMEEYGTVFAIPSALGSTRYLISDSRAMSHVYMNHDLFRLTDAFRTLIATFFGRGLLGVENPDHSRQRKQLTPAFSNAAIRRVTPVFFDCAYKIVEAWDAVLESAPLGQSPIEVQSWMNRVSLDSIGIAGFDHDFESLLEKPSAMTELFDSFGAQKASVFSTVMMVLSTVFPVFLRVPTPRMEMIRKLTDTTREISLQLLERSLRESKMEGGPSVKEDKSLIGLLIKSESAGGVLGMSQDEIIAQMNVLLFAGFETTSISLTWALLELARNPDMQTKLRKEILAFSPSDPTWDQLHSTEALPYLDAVVHETLRLRPPVAHTDRTSSKDQFIPLGTPIVTADGTIVDQIFVAKGQSVMIPIVSINRSSQWGDDAESFAPERWLRGDTSTTGLPNGHRHLLTFIDGPRVCLGKSFALAEFKAVLCVLIRKYEFEMPKDSVIEGHRTILWRPKFAGEDGFGLSLIVKKVVQQ